MLSKTGVKVVMLLRVLRPVTPNLLARFDKVSRFFLCEGVLGDAARLPCLSCVRGVALGCFRCDEGSAEGLKDGFLADFTVGFE